MLTRLLMFMEGNAQAQGRRLPILGLKLKTIELLQVLEIWYKNFFDPRRNLKNLIVIISQR